MNAEHAAQTTPQTMELRQDLTRLKGRLLVFQAVQEGTSLQPAFQFAFGQRNTIVPHSVTLWAHRTGRNVEHERVREAVRRVRKDAAIAREHGQGVVLGDRMITLRDLIDQTRLQAATTIVELKRVENVG